MLVRGVIRMSKQMKLIMERFDKFKNEALGGIGMPLKMGAATAIGKARKTNNAAADQLAFELEDLALKIRKARGLEPDTQQGRNLGQGSDEDIVSMIDPGAPCERLPIEIEMGDLRVLGSDRKASSEMATKAKEALEARYRAYQEKFIEAKRDVEQYMYAAQDLNPGNEEIRLVLSRPMKAEPGKGTEEIHIVTNGEQDINPCALISALEDLAENIHMILV